MKTEGLAHLSHVVGSSGDAAVIDPRRDCETYIDIAVRNGCQISSVFETHRNEDLLSGSADLARRTAATVYHGPGAAGNIEYAETVTDGDEFDRQEAIRDS